MNREQFYHLLRASAEIVERQRAMRGIDVNEQPARIIVIGSQSILGSWSDEYLPDYTTRSAEMDVAFIPTAGDEYAFDMPRQELADLIEGYLGEETRFRDAFKVYAQGVDTDTAILPVGWGNRLVRLEVPDQQTRTEIYCLDPYDLCAAKLTRLEEKDRLYVGSLIKAGDIDAAALRERVAMIHDPRFTVPLHVQAQDFLNAFGVGQPRRREPAKRRTRRTRHLR